MPSNTCLTPSAFVCQFWPKNTLAQRLPVQKAGFARAQIKNLDKNLKNSTDSVCAILQLWSLKDDFTKRRLCMNIMNSAQRWTYEAMNDQQGLLEHCNIHEIENIFSVHCIYDILTHIDIDSFQYYETRVSECFLCSYATWSCIIDLWIEHNIYWHVKKEKQLVSVT